MKRFKWKYEAVLFAIIGGGGLFVVPVIIGFALDVGRRPYGFKEAYRYLISWYSNTYAIEYLYALTFPIVPYLIVSIVRLGHSFWIRMRTGEQVEL